MTRTAANRKPLPRSNDLTIQRFNRSTVQRFNAFPVEICILAGGLSTRMGRDKSRLRLGSTTMLGHIRKIACAIGLPVRVIRRDCVPKCGPLGGIYTALKSTKADAVLFLACDMPFISAELIQFLLQKAVASPVARRSVRRTRLVRGVSNEGGSRSAMGKCLPLFARSRGRAGFPFILPREAIETVSRQIQQGDVSLCATETADRFLLTPRKRQRTAALQNLADHGARAKSRQRLGVRLSSAAFSKTAMTAHHIHSHPFSLQTLAKAVRATILPLKHPWSRQLLNVNTPEEWADVSRRLLRPGHARRIAD